MRTCQDHATKVTLFVIQRRGKNIVFGEWWNHGRLFRKQERNRLLLVIGPGRKLVRFTQPIEGGPAPDMHRRGGYKTHIHRERRL